MTSFFLRQLIEFLILVPSALLAYYPLKGRMRIRQPHFYLAVLLVVVGSSFVGAGLSTYFPPLSDVFFYGAAGLCYFLFCVLGTAELSKKIFCLSNASMLGAFAVAYTNYLAAPIEDGSDVFTVPAGLICLGIAALLIPIFYRTLTEKISTLLYDERPVMNWWLLSVFLFFITVLLVWMTPDNAAEIPRDSRLLALIALPLFPIAALLIYHLLWQTTVRLTENARLEEENNMLQMEQKRYEAFRNYMEETRILRHDFRHHLIVMARLSADGKTEELDAYLRQLNAKAVPEHVRYCANPAVDAIAARNAELASAQGIRLIWDLDLGESLPVEDADFCGVLGNLVENAIRAASQEAADKHWVKVRSRMLSDAMLGLSVENPCSRKVKFKNGLPVTDRSGHGVGMTSVAATVRRYGGTMEFKTENGLFSVNILFYSH